MKVPFNVVFLIIVLIFGSCLGNLSQTALNAMFSGIASDFFYRRKLRTVGYHYLHACFRYYRSFGHLSYEAFC